MRKLIVVLLIIAAAGCATPRAPEPVAPAVAPISPEARAESTPAPVAEKPAAPTAQPASPALQPSSELAQPPARQPAEMQKPAERAQPPVMASKQPEAPVSDQKKKPALESRGLPVPDHKLRSLAELAEANDEKIMNVFVGMYRKTVDMIMGTERNPYRRTTINGTDGQEYDVLFYLTREPRKGKSVTDRMLTPVIMKKGRVVAIGNYQLKKLIHNGTLDRPKLAAGVRR